MEQTVEHLIIGAGVAGLSTAAHLALAGTRGVLVLDREQQVGFYSSSNNAAIARQLTGTDAHTDLTRKGRDRLAELGLMESSGGILLAAKAGGLDPLAEEAARFGIHTRRTAGSPYPDCIAAEALEVPSDGVIAIDDMLSWCAMTIKVNGGTVRLDTDVESIKPVPDGCLVETSRGTFRARTVINAAGGWAQRIGELASAQSIAFRPLRRHLIWSSAAHPQDRPWVWWADLPFYIRPESGGALMSPLDETEIAPPRRNEQPQTDPGVLEGMSETLQKTAPTVADYPISRLWCGLRTFAPDRRFVIGCDKKNPRMFWVAGLGGHGMTSGLAVGRLAADLIMGGGSSGALDPDRFA